MKLVVKLKLKTDTQTDRLLRETTEQYWRACNHLSQTAFTTKIFFQYDLHHRAYYEIKARFELPAQLVIRAIAQVCSAYKSLQTQVQEHNRRCCPEEQRELTPIEFAPHLAVPYDQRILSYCSDDRVCLRLLQGRVCFDFAVGEKRKHLLHLNKGQADLKRMGKEWFLFQTVEMDEPDLQSTANFIGVDCGICTVASSHDGSQTLRFPGHRVRQVRRHYSQLRRGLARHNTKSSRRRVRKLRDRESRIVRSLNHLISRRIVSQAERTNSTIVLEDLEGIKEGLRVRKGQRYERFSWSYAQLQHMLVYKARLAGIPVIFVPPAYTSKSCSRCHYMHDGNRATQAWFGCRACGYLCLADDNAAVNIRFLGGESTAHKRSVYMQEYLHTDRRKPLGFSLHGR